MRPKTRLEKEVYSLSNKLPPVSNKAIKWAYKHLFEHDLFISSKRYLCLDCGHQWKPDNKRICPNCKAQLTTLPGKKRTTKRDAYLVIATTFRGWQVFRFYYCKKESSTNSPLFTSHGEVYQHWFNSNGRHVVMAVNTYCFGSSRYSVYDPWSYGTMSIKYDDNKYYGWNTNEGENYQSVYPRTFLIPALKRNGYDINIIKSLKLHIVFAADLLLNDSMAETIFKAAEYDLFNAIGMGHRDVRNYWQQVKIAMRHKYKISNVSTWLDHLYMLKQEGFDITNPKYICPDSLDKAHQDLVQLRRLRREREERKNLELMQAKDKHDQLTYKDHVMPFKRLKIASGDLVIKPILSVRTMRKEGDMLNHCVYYSHYYSRRDSLILSARMNNKPLATIEFSLKDMNVEQCRGYNNNVPERYSEIIELINNNKTIIKKCLKRKELLSA